VYDELSLVGPGRVVAKAFEMPVIHLWKSVNRTLGNVPGVSGHQILVQNLARAGFLSAWTRL
jgi:hypothetical protein